MKALALLCGPALVVAAIHQAGGGDGFALALTAGFLAFYAVVGALLLWPLHPELKADPAKIARLERELGIVPDPAVEIACDEALSKAEARRQQEAVTERMARTYHGAPTFGHPIIDRSAR